MKIYFIDRYDEVKPGDYKNHSGYEQVIKYAPDFIRVKGHAFVSNILFLFVKKSKPVNYIRLNLSKEFYACIKAFITGCPVFYLYADKDAFLLPLIKKRLGLSRIKLFGTLHWPREISADFSLYKNDLASVFNGVIVLSSSLLSLPHSNPALIPHGVDFNYWHNSQPHEHENIYLVIGESNRNHQRQADVLHQLSMMDENASFFLLMRNSEQYGCYKPVPRLQVLPHPVADDELKKMYQRAKAVVLIQDYCLASNVVLECIAMCVPVIANNVGDIVDYLGVSYPLYINETDMKETLHQFCHTEELRNKTVHYMQSLQPRFNWQQIADTTVYFIENSVQPFNAG